MSTAFQTSDDVYQFMSAHMVNYTFRGEPQQFLPRLDLEKVITKEVIRLVCTEDKDLFLGDVPREQFVDQVYSKGRILFATCLFADLPMSYLKGLLDDDLTDAKIPLKKGDCSNMKLQRKFNHILDNQKRFFVACLNLDSMQSLDGITKPIHFDEDPIFLLGHGAFGEVWEIEIHEDHRSFFRGASAPTRFAMKITKNKGREPRFHQTMANLTHSHLLKCLASFTSSSQYYMIYEKADKDLEKLMKECNQPTTLKTFSARDLARQLYGLAGALSVVHNQENIEPSYDRNLLGVPQKDLRQRSGYIHDIKPDNILVFTYQIKGKQIYWFRLSDYSSANVVDFVESVSGQHRDSWRTNHKKSTPNYRAPEFLSDEGISRPFDLWSLGCVYIELLTWFTEGFGKLETFRRSRLRQVKPDGIEDEGFWYTNEKGKNPKAYVRDVVKKKMEYLSAHCTGELKDIADIIPELLDINPKKRPTARELLERLKHLDTDEAPPFDYSRPDSLVLPGLDASATSAYDSDSDSSSFAMVNVIGATQ